MKKVLIISYYWPPAGGPGSQRVVKFVKYLPKFGWQPVVLTVEKGEFPYLDKSLEEDIPEDIKVFRTKSWEPFRLFKKMTGRKPGESLPVGYIVRQPKNFKERLAQWMRANLFIPDARIGWIPFMVRETRKIIREESIDLIFTSSPPHSLQLAGKILKKKTGLPWIADFRDRWTGIRYYQLLKRSAIANQIDKYLERRVLKTADIITATSRGFLTAFKSRITSGSNEKFFYLPNGYDETDFINLRPKKETKFNILHTGNLIEQQNPVVLWKSLKTFLSENPKVRKNIEVKFIGRVSENIIASAKEYDLADITVTRDYIPHRQALIEMKNSSILLAVIPDLPDNHSIFLGKIYEYIGSGRPILVIGPPEGDAGKVITGFPNSSICGYNDIEKCISFFKKMYNLWSENKLPESTYELRSFYSRENLTKNLAEIFNLKNK